MDIKDIQTLAQQPPPRSGGFKFSTWRDADLAIRQLEKSLGLPAGPTILSIANANARVDQLVKLVLLRDSAQTPGQNSKPALFGWARAVAATKIEKMEPARAPNHLKGLDRFRASIRLEGQKRRSS